MSRLGVPPTLSHRERGSSSTNLYSHSNEGSFTSSPFSRTPVQSGRTSPYAQGDAAYGAQRFAEDLEGQNDERLEGLTAKVKILKDITIGIGNEVRDSTVQLSQMVCQILYTLTPN
ncbi:hypothetical protein FRB99_002490 [Tulasnella sp. 403]|nr:hypothetical protein FRB99_002490 [Tulasnella sp. 403]